VVARRRGEEAQACVEARGGVRRRWRLGSISGCDVLTGAQVSRISRWLPYEKDDHEKDGVCRRR
jgi:hypothetical protein